MKQERLSACKENFIYGWINQGPASAESSPRCTGDNAAFYLPVAKLVLPPLVSEINSSS